MDAKRLLIVDDDVMMTDIMQDIMCDEGFFADTANSCEDALALVLSNEYHAVITDLIMGDTSGIELLRRLSGRFPSLRLFAMTAYPSEEYTRRAKEAGAMDVFEKPFDIARMIHAVRA